MSRLTSAQLMAALPAATRAQLPTPFQKFKTSHRSWLFQLYYNDPQLHYEVWNMGERRGKLEIGLHFESRDSARNRRLLQNFSQRMVAVKATLGAQWEAEMWDKGWTKVYETIAYEPFDHDYLSLIARELAQAILVLQPMLVEIRD